MASDLIIIRFKECKDTERFLSYLSRDNPRLFSDDTDGDLIVWSHEPILITKTAYQFSFDEYDDSGWSSFEPDIVKATMVKREEDVIWVR